MSGMDCIVVGGVADGTLLRDVDMDAEYIELRRPEYIKPLAAPDAQPDVQTGDAEVLSNPSVLVLDTLRINCQ